MTSNPQRRTVLAVAVGYLRKAGAYGLTWRDLAEITGTHHGQASSALSTLHRTGGASRLKQRRDRCGVYVLNEFIDGRPTVPFRANRRYTGHALTPEQVQVLINYALNNRLAIYDPAPDVPSLARLIAHVTKEGPTSGKPDNHDQT